MSLYKLVRFARLISITGIGKMESRGPPGRISHHATIEIRLMPESPVFRFDPFELVHPPDVVAEFIERLTAGLHPVNHRRGTERRSQPRCILSTPVDAQSLDDGFETEAETFRAETHDISTTGIGLIHTRPVNTKYLALRLTHPDGEQLQTVIEVVRCRRRGRLFDVGGIFVTKSPLT